MTPLVGAQHAAPGHSGSSVFIENLDTDPVTGLADVTWELTTPRTGWSTASLTLQWSDAELGNLIEDTLRLHQAPSASGPWTEIAIQSLDLTRNEVIATVSALNHFALRGNYPTGSTGMSTEGILEYLLGEIPEVDGMDVNDDGVVNAGDLVLNIEDIANNPMWHSRHRQGRSVVL